MDIGNKGLLTLLVSIPIIGLIVRFILKSRKQRRVTSRSVINNLNEPHIREKIIEYFREYENDIKQFELHNYFSRQFDLDDLIREYERKKSTIRTLKELSIVEEKEYQAGNKILIEMAQNIKGQSIRMDWGDALIFLLNYYELTGKKKALCEIENRIKDVSRYGKYVQDINKKINNLITK